MGLYSNSKDILDDFFKIDRDYKNLLKACMYNNMLPLGLITSPILSDIYLHEFDRKVSNLLSACNKRIIFTRYADDMFFSCKEEMDNNDIDYITNSLSQELVKINLQINQEKTVCKKLENIGDHIKILGLNIVKTQTQNEITVGKKFVNDTCKMYLQNLDNKNNDEVLKESKFYGEKRIAGRIAYIGQIEGIVGYEKLRKRILKSTDNRVNIPDHIIKCIYSMKPETDSVG